MKSIMCIAFAVCLVLCTETTLGNARRLASNNRIVADQTTEGSACPVGYTYYAATDSCYKWHPIRSTWYAAEGRCVVEGGHLASVTSDDEHSFLVENAPNKVNYWIGLNDQQQEAGKQRGGTWQWTDGTHYSHHNWCDCTRATWWDCQPYDGFFEYDGASYDFVYIRKSGACWANVTPGNRYNFICKTKPITNN